MVAGGNRHAFSIVYERYRAPLSRYCRSILHHPDDAADAVQNAMLKALAGLEREAPAGPLRPWLYRIAHNESIDLIRRRQRSAEDLVAEPPDVSDVSASTEVADQLQALFSDLRELPERQRGALLMRELAGLEYEQIGRVFATSSVAARKLVYEARVSLSAQRDGRSTDCDHICRQLSDGDGRTARARSVRAHLAACEACTAFERSLRTRREQLALIPALPLLGGGAWLAATIGGGAGATKGAIAGGGAVAGGAMAGSSALTAGAGVGAGATSAGVVSGLGSALAVKCLTVCGALAVAGAGTAIATSAGHHVAPTAHRLALAGGAGSASASVGDAHPGAAKRTLAQAASAQADQKVAAAGTHASAVSSHITSGGSPSNSGAGSHVTSLGVTSSVVSRPISAGTGSPSGATGTGSASGATTGTAGASSSAGSKPGSGPSSGSSAASGSSSTSTVAAGSGSTSSGGSVTTPASTAPTGSGTGSTGPSGTGPSGTGQSGTSQSGSGLPGTPSGTATANDTGGTASTTGYAGLINGIISSSTTAAASSSQLAGGIEGLVSSMLSGYTGTTGQSGTSASSSASSSSGYGSW
jgi:RNA polymerase sigma factor (sigma-70 family)